MLWKKGQHNVVTLCTFGQFSDVLGQKFKARHQLLLALFWPFKYYPFKSVTNIIVGAKWLVCWVTKRWNEVFFFLALIWSLVVDWAQNTNCLKILLNLFHVNISWKTIKQPVFLVSNPKTSFICCEVGHHFCFWFCEIFLGIEIFGSSVYWHFRLCTGGSFLWRIWLHNAFKTCICFCDAVKLCTQSNRKRVFM